jgi:predicted phosphodiesterase
MIRLGIVSDLHLELERKSPPVDAFRFTSPDLPIGASVGPRFDALVGLADLVVLAGDIDNKLRGISYAQLVASYVGVPVVYVAGNHEFYGTDLGLVSHLRDTAELAEGVRFLDNERADFEVRGRRVAVFGTTLWTDFRVLGHERTAEAIAEARTRMSDYELIRSAVPGWRLDPVDTIAEHHLSRAWLDQELASVEPDVTAVVVTHHAPSARSLPRSLAADPAAGAYASDLEELIARRRPALWIHGHTHWPTKYRIHDTLVVCQALGYPNERTVFEPLVVSLP